MTEQTMKSAVGQMAIHMANLYYFLTREMLDAYGDGAKAVIRRAIISFGRYRGQEIAKQVLADGGELTIENLDRYYDIPIVEGWEPQRVYDQEGKFNITPVCAMAEVWKVKGWQDVGHLYCLIDIAIREGYSSLGTGRKVVFKPGKNALLGDDCCTSETVYEPAADV